MTRESLSEETHCGTSNHPTQRQAVNMKRSQSASDPAASSSRGCVAATPDREAEDDIRHVLEVAQAPTRGRTCGFGDADRRALSAPLIARLRVYRVSDGSEIPADDVDISFMVVAADLWSADGTQDMNLVQHPASHFTKSLSPAPLDDYRPTSSYDDAQRFSYSSSTLYSSQDRPHSNGNGVAGLSVETTQFAFGAQHPLYGRAPPRSMEHLYARGYPYPPHATTASSIASTSKLPETPVKSETLSGSPPFNTFAFQAPRPSPPSQHHPLPADVEGERYSTAGSSYIREQPSTSASAASSLGPRLTTMSTRRPSTGATSIAAHVASDYAAGPKVEVAEMACVKNLIGALSTNGHKLKAPGESSLGIFFVFHDLSVRTEGTFTIRLRLVSIGRQPIGTLTGVQPVLSECFTPPFEVMSAKKFLGMLDPTPMSQAFAKQGLRIPTRKGANRKRRRQEGPGSREGRSPTPDDEEVDI